MEKGMEDDGGRQGGRHVAENETSQAVGDSVSVGMVVEERENASTRMFVFYLWANVVCGTAEALHLEGDAV